MTSILFINTNVFDGEHEELLEGYTVHVEDGVITRVSAEQLKPGDSEVIDVRGKTLMPGLIDAHVHVTDHDVSPAALYDTRPSLVALRAAKIMRDMLNRGFTTVRDASGADSGLEMAVEEGLIHGPRLFHCGRGLSITGGHGDFRSPGNDVNPEHFCCGGRGMTVIADGVPEVRKAAREELRRGAHAIKIMASGGVTSPSDPIYSRQYSEEEISAAVDEAALRDTYVLAHAYGDQAIRRSLENGVRSIEHANFIELETAKLAAERQAFVVPTLVTYDAMTKHGKEIGLPDYSINKLAEVQKSGLVSLDHLKSAKVNTGFGTDLFGVLHDLQSEEFRIRAEVQSNHEILLSATSCNARLLNMEDKLGCIKQGAHADLLIIDGNPLADINVLIQNGSRITHIMKAGKFYKREA